LFDKKGRAEKKRKQEDESYRADEHEPLRKAANPATPRFPWIIQTPMLQKVAGIG